MSTPSEEACGARLVRPEYLTESGYQDRAAALELIGARSRTFVTPIECGADLALVHHRLVFSDYMYQVRSVCCVARRRRPHRYAFVC